MDDEERERIMAEARAAVASPRDFPDARPAPAEDELVLKRYPPRAAPAPERRELKLDTLPATWWPLIDARIEAAIVELREGTGGALSDIRRQLRDEFADAIGEQRAELNVQRAAVT